MAYTKPYIPVTNISIPMAIRITPPNTEAFQPRRVPAFAPMKSPAIQIPNVTIPMIRQDITAWSVIFEPEKRKLTYYFRGDFEKPFVLEF